MKEKLKGQLNLNTVLLALLGFLMARYVQQNDHALDAHSSAIALLNDATAAMRSRVEHLEWLGGVASITNAPHMGH